MDGFLWMAVFLEGWMGFGMGFGMDRLVSGLDGCILMYWIDEWTDGWKDGWKDGCTVRLFDGWVDG